MFYYHLAKAARLTEAEKAENDRKWDEIWRAHMADIKAEHMSERTAVMAKIDAGMATIFEAALAAKIDGEYVYDDKVARAALRIAAAVMRPGVLEKAVDDGGGQSVNIPGACSAIRKALTDG